MGGGGYSISEEGPEGGRGGAYAFVACLSRLTIVHASLETEHCAGFDFIRVVSCVVCLFCSLIVHTGQQVCFVFFPEVAKIAARSRYDFGSCCLLSLLL